MFTLLRRRIPDHITVSSNRDPSTLLTSDCKLGCEPATAGAVTDSVRLTRGLLATPGRPTVTDVDLVPPRPDVPRTRLAVGKSRLSQQLSTRKLNLMQCDSDELLVT
jgi:hypothetical protein